MRISCTAALLLVLATTPSFAAQIPVTSYSHAGADGGFYSDIGGVELTDGVDANIAWGSGNLIGGGDIIPLVGWQLTNPTIEFEFGTAATVGSVEVWLADSDGSAGVHMPSAITLSTAGGYSQTFPVINPVGSGAMVPVTIGGLMIVSDSVTVTAVRDESNSWTMLSEVRFFAAVPEPTAAGLLLFGFVLLRSRRVR